MVSLGERGLVAALEKGEVQAGIVEEPAASRLVAEHRAVILADLRTPAAVERALATATLNAGVFMRADRKLSDRDLAAVVRALRDAERLIATSRADTLAARLPKAVVGIPEDFARRLEAARTLYLPEGAVTLAQVRESIAIVRAHMPFSPALRIPRPEDLVYAPAVKRSPGRQNQNSPAAR
jgi:ABC-type nitrate/sulfonate/bicarbonate transport system substrate-binding protein